MGVHIQQGDIKELARELRTIDGEAAHPSCDLHERLAQGVRSMLEAVSAWGATYS